MLNRTIRPIDCTLSGPTTPWQSGPGRDGNKGLPCIPKCSSIIEALPSDYFASYSGHSLVGLSYPSAGIQLVFSTAQAVWTIQIVIVKFWLNCVQHTVYVNNENGTMMKWFWIYGIFVGLLYEENIDLPKHITRQLTSMCPKLYELAGGFNVTKLLVIFCEHKTNKKQKKINW